MAATCWGGERSAITVGAIARAVLDQDKPAAFEELPSLSMQRVVLPMIEQVQLHLFEELDRITLGDLCRASRLAGLSGKCDGMVDFVI